MKNTLYWWLLLLSMTFVAACSDGGEDVVEPDPKPTPSKPAITLDVSSSDFTTDGGSNTISFTTAAPWTAEVLNSRADAWCSVSPTSGPAGDAEITVTTTSNDTPDNRSASIVLKAGTTEKTITVSQKQKDALTVTSDKFEVSAEGGEVTIEVKANIDFEYTISEKAKVWIASADSRALKTTTLVFDVSANEDTEKREGSITITSGSFKETVTVYQEGTVPVITLTQNEFVVPSAGDVIAVEVKSNVDVEVELPAETDWLSEDKSRAMSTNTYYFIVAESGEYEQREAEIKFTNKKNELSETVKVVQVQKDAIVVAKNEYEMDVEGGALDFEILTNVDVTVSIPDSVADWISHVESRALESQTLHFDIAPCDLSENRSGTITLSGGDAVQTILIKQDGLSAILEAERNALMAFYNATGGENWTNNTNWGSDKPFGEWYGITTNQIGLVEDINLDNNNLTGNIPESIGDLKQLVSIHLSSNELTGELPESIGNLTNLRLLFIYDNNLSGCIPKSFCNLKKMEYVNLDMNGLSGELPTAIGNLTELRSFCAINNNFTGSIPESIGDLINLEILYLDSNQLTGELPTSIGNLIKLSHFMVGFNNLTGTIPESIKNMNSLTNFYIRSNYFTGKVPEFLMEMDTWPTGWHEILDQRGDGFSNEGLVIPAPKFSENTIDGEALDYSVYSKNEFTILYHYFDWCHWSYDFTPTLVELYNGYKNKGLEVIAFSGEGTIESNRKFAETFNTEWPYITLSNNKDMFNAHTWISPGVCVVDKDGYIIFNSVTYDWRDIGKFLYEKLGPLDSSDPSDTPQLYESIDYSKDGEVKQLQKATKGRGVNIVLMGDAYSDRLITDGTYDQTMQSAMEAFFNVEPYKSFRDHFNVFSVTAVSKNEIYSQHSETTFKGYFGDDTLVGGNDSIVFSYALKAISEEQMDEALIVVMMNSMEYAGTCYMYMNLYGDWGNGVSVSYFPVGEDTESIERLIHHEAAGHGFAKLADEYAYYENGHVPNEEVEACRNVDQYGWWKNVDFTNDLSQIRWSKFINDSRYANEGLGAYEGGLTYWTGVWRPTENSIMRYNTGGFNAPSREAIYYRIHKLAYGADWQYDYEKFVEWDAINRNSTTARSLNHVEVPKKFKPLHAPVVKRQTWKDAK